MEVAVEDQALIGVVSCRRGESSRYRANQKRDFPGEVVLPRNFRVTASQSIAAHGAIFLFGRGVAMAAVRIPRGGLLRPAAGGMGPQRSIRVTARHVREFAPTHYRVIGELRPEY